MGWKKMKVSRRMSSTDRLLRILTIAMGIFCVAILLYGQLAIR